MDWRGAYSDSYHNAYINLCLPKLLSPLVRHQMLAWDPLKVNGNETHTHTHMSEPTHMREHAHAFVRTHTHTHTREHTQTHAHTREHTHTHAQTHTRTHARKHARTHTCANTRLMPINAVSYELMKLKRHVWVCVSGCLCRLRSASLVPSGGDILSRPRLRRARGLGHQNTAQCHREDGPAKDNR